MMSKNEKKIEFCFLFIKKLYKMFSLPRYENG